LVDAGAEGGHEVLPQLHEGVRGHQHSLFAVTGILSPPALRDGSGHRVALQGFTKGSGER
ncbi:MAG TPA: hypothetical protein VL281_11450, partial [Mycobacteriales bacterium]|nr:hypothetical protein [Mycobacteriales bacterium]